MQMNKIISDSNKYHQENKTGIVLEGDRGEGGKMLIWIGCWERPCWGGGIGAETWVDKGGQSVPWQKE